MVDKSFKIDRSRLVNLTIQLSYIFGLWPKADSTIIYTIYRYIFQSLTSIAWTIAKCIGTYMLTDRKEVILLSASSVYCVVATYRGIIFMGCYKTFDVCLGVISDFQLSKDEYEIIQPKMKFFSKLSITYTTFIFSGLGSAFLNPVLSAEKVMPIPIWLPYIYWQENDRDFIIGLVFSVTGIASLTITIAFLPIIVWYLLYATSLMIEVLGHRLQHLGYDRKTDEEIFAELVRCIELDRQIDDDTARSVQVTCLNFSFNRNIKKIEKSFSSVFFLQITSSAICLCSIAYLMAAASDNINDNNMYLSLGGVYTLDIFVLIYFANEVSLKSGRLSGCIYESNWTCMPFKCRKFIVIICEKWKKPKELVVGKIFAMRINILKSIVNLAYSILNVLRKEQS